MPLTVRSSFSKLGDSTYAPGLISTVSPAATAAAASPMVLHVGGLPLHPAAADGSTVYVVAALAAAGTASVRTAPTAAAIHDLRLISARITSDRGKGCGTSPQLGAAELAAGRAGKRPAQLDLLGHLEAGQTGRGVGAELVGRRGRAGMQDHGGHDALPPLGVGAPERGGLRHGRVVLQHPLHLGGRDVLPSGDDRLAAPADDGQA